MVTARTAVTAVHEFGICFRASNDYPDDAWMSQRCYRQGQDSLNLPSKKMSQECIVFCLHVHVERQ